MDRVITLFLLAIYVCHVCNNEEWILFGAYSIGKRRLKFTEEIFFFLTTDDHKESFGASVDEVVFDPVELGEFFGFC